MLRFSQLLFIFYLKQAIYLLRNAFASWKKWKPAIKK